MKIVEKDFTLEPADVDSNSYNLIFNKRVKKRDTGKFEIEPGDPLYGLSLSSALLRIAKHRVAKKYEEENITLMEYLKSLNASYRAVVKLCKESMPEKLDTGD